MATSCSGDTSPCLLKYSDSLIPMVVILIYLESMEMMPDSRQEGKGEEKASGSRNLMEAISQQMVVISRMLAIDITLRFIWSCV